MTATKNEIYFDFDPWALAGKKKPKDKSELAAAKREIADFVLEAVIDAVGDGNSPVAGGKWKKSLSPAYKKLKSKESGVSFANMELTGEMLDSLEVVNQGSKLRLRVKGEAAGRADGHNNHSGKSKLPPREFIPKDKGTFKRQIIMDIRDIIEEHSDG